MSEPTVIDIDLFVSPYCPHCSAALAELQSAGPIGGRQVVVRRLNVVEHLDSAVAAGVRRTPALVRDGRVLACGSLAAADVRRILEKEVGNAPDHW